MTKNSRSFRGLTASEILQSRAAHGGNKLEYGRQNAFLEVLQSLISDPMVILLLVTSLIYFITGSPGDAIFLAVAILFVAAISLYQDSRSKDALEKLKRYTQPKSKVIRNHKTEEIESEDIVVGDLIVVEEGTTIPADARVIQSNDFTVNESILTGEAFSVYKDADEPENEIFMGTLVQSGLAIAKVSKVGNQTKLGNIGKSLEDVTKEKTPLQVQINSFIRTMVIAGSIIFALVWLINFVNSRDILDSLLKALTLAMSILPEEIPVAFTTFMALGAWRLMKMGVIVKQMNIVESLGSATVVCVDKTGTITENRMTLKKLYSIDSDRIVDVSQTLNQDEKELIRMAMWSSEPIPFDPMEISIHDHYTRFFTNDERPNYNMVHEYPLGGKPPMMTHIFENNNAHRIIAAKGAPEGLLAVSDLNETDKLKIQQVIHDLAKEGYRLLGVGHAQYDQDGFLTNQQDYDFRFNGIVAFYDPPKESSPQVLQDFYQAGIEVKMITGDNETTSNAIARQVGFKNADRTISGDRLVQITESDLNQIVDTTTVYTRMYPEAKLRVINALKNQGHIVAMTGDGVNDGPALKAAHIGIAMGKKGTEIAKQSASLILADDDLSNMVGAVAMGRKIYTNLKKAIQYIISIHIPIILTVFLPLALGWKYPNIFTPVHIILLELIMGPTCSIVYENEPLEKNVMVSKPRPFTTTFFNWNELITSIIQGLVITAGALFIYQLAINQGANEPVTRAMVFTTLITANIFLTFVNRSFYYSIFTTLRYKNNLVPLIIGVTLIIMVSLLCLNPLTDFFKFEQLRAGQILTCLIVGLVSVVWYEMVKWGKRHG